jgi:hypothetical protein
MLDERQFPRPALTCHRSRNLTPTDALHLVLREPLHCVPSMARHRHALTPHLPRRHRAVNRGLRMGTGHEQEIRTEPQRSHAGICNHHTTYVCPRVLHPWYWLQAESAFPSAEGSRVSEISSLLSPGKDARSAAEQKGVIVKAAFYAVQVFYSFFIM